MTSTIVPTFRLRAGYHLYPAGDGIWRCHTADGALVKVHAPTAVLTAAQSLLYGRPTPVHEPAVTQLLDLSARKDWLKPAKAPAVSRTRSPARVTVTGTGSVPAALVELLTGAAPVECFADDEHAARSGYLSAPPPIGSPNPPAGRLRSAGRVQGLVAQPGDTPGSATASTVPIRSGTRCRPARSPRLVSARNRLRRPRRPRPLRLRRDVRPLPARTCRRRRHCRLTHRTEMGSAHRGLRRLLRGLHRIGRGRGTARCRAPGDQYGARDGSGTGEVRP